MQARTATMALSSKKTYPMSPIFRGFFISYAGIANCKDLLYIESRESFLKVEDVQWIC